MRQWARGETAEGLPERSFKADPRAVEPEPPPIIATAVPQRCQDCSEPLVEDAVIGLHCRVCLSFGRTPLGAPAMEPIKRTCRSCRKPYMGSPVGTAMCRECSIKRLARKTADTPRYTVSSDGEDALLKFGRHRGRTLSDLAKGSDASYLDFLITERDEDDRLKFAFPDELRGLAKRWKKVAIEESKKIKLFEDDSAARRDEDE